MYSYLCSLFSLNYFVCNISIRRPIPSCLFKMKNAIPFSNVIVNLETTPSPKLITSHPSVCFATSCPRCWSAAWSLISTAKLWKEFSMTVGIISPRSLLRIPWGVPNVKFEVEKFDPTWSKTFLGGRESATIALYALSTMHGNSVFACFIPCILSGA